MAVVFQLEFGGDFVEGGGDGDGVAAKAAFLDDVGVLVGAVILLAGGNFLHHPPKILNE